MSSSLTDIVLIPGGWHIPASYRKFTTALSTAFPSLRVTVLPLPSITNDPSPTADFYTDSAFVRSSVTQMISEGRRLAILMHSYGGQVGSNALHDLHPQEPSTSTDSRGGITHLIYIAAAMLFPGTLMSRPYGDSKPNVALVSPSDYDFGPERVVALHPVEMWIGTREEDKGEATEEEIREWVDTIWPISTRVFSQELQFAAWMEGRKMKVKEGMEGGKEEEKGEGERPEVVYVMCTKDTAVPYELQEWMVGRAREEVGVDVKVWKMETGHMPTLTATGELVRILGEVLGKVLGEYV
ncbi:hypothetical protein SMACR_08766 [Sordaria macrospora]|uniref:WGS project CABT00000000 data, contig 2.65 n=2 Tax=Sordaria macrospora TaxID=5147 RepID=F7WAT9_SORMK|nr:uncharacterized protein SMAC_08766 [Sordaria macrospora k-hell]KAA8629279.1 hypothetical protein SMACR_08766 [Sordaria macrospora]WPJ67269.1 hypothetical protein SMAC4_08766 [Sordaria macrospora]CCC14254.1 unnamed protein product [Sordaria macrospora k-hell]